MFIIFRQYVCAN